MQLQRSRRPACTGTAPALSPCSAQYTSGVHSKFRFPSLAMHHRQREGTDSTRPHRRVRPLSSASCSRLALVPTWLPVPDWRRIQLPPPRVTPVGLLPPTPSPLASRGTSRLTRQNLQTTGIWRPRLTNCRCCASRPISPALLARA